MASERLINVSDSQEEAKKQAKKIGNSFWWFVGIIAVAIIIPIFFFFKNRFYSGKDWILDNGAVGNYGDLIGGVAGTIVALYSAYLLVSTLRDQIVVNNENIESNRKVLQTNRTIIQQTNRQIFESRFISQFNMYHQAVDAYSCGNLKGRDAMDELVKAFCNRSFSYNSHYTSRNNAAIKKFEDFYAQNSRYLSVHLRMLYILMKMIGEQDCMDDDNNVLLTEDDRVMYAKSVRGQLSEGEMLLMRYNCQTNRGRNMRHFVNQFNLIKHFPLLSLLEFKKYRQILGDKEDEISALDAHFIELKKYFLEHITRPDTCGDFEISPKYKLKLSLSADNKVLTMKVEANTARQRPGIMGYSLIERALNEFDRDTRDDMYFDFLREYLVFSNFKIYNDPDNLTFNQPNNCDANGFEITEYIITNSEKFVFAAWQMNTPS